MIRTDHTCHYCGEPINIWRSNTPRPPEEYPVWFTPGEATGNLSYAVAHPKCHAA